KISYPIIDLTMFRNYHFTNSVIAILMYMLVITGVFFIFPFYLEEAKGLSVYLSGLLMLIPAATGIILEPISGAASDRTGCRIICSIGALLLSLAFTCFIFLKHETNFAYIIFSLLLLGIGMGIFPSPNGNIIMSHAPEGRAGIASSIRMASRKIGSVLGVCLFEFVFSMTMHKRLLTHNINLRHAGVPGTTMDIALKYVFIVGFICCIIALIFSIFAKSKNE
ncbi:MAG: MFS transporter, partial [Armatimonadota bacterium]